MALSNIHVGSLVTNAYSNDAFGGGPKLGVLSYNATAGETTITVPLYNSSATFSGLLFVNGISISGVQAIETLVNTNNTASATTGLIQTNGTLNTATFTRTFTSSSQCQVLVVANSCTQITPAS